MITKTQFDTQLQQIYAERILQGRTDVQVVFFQDSALLIHLSPKPSIREKTGATLLLGRIEYSEIYQEPSLYIQLIEHKRGLDGLEIISHPSINDMNVFLPDDYQTLFVIQPEILDGSVWWCFHQCDTSKIVGENSSTTDTYLKRWISVFLFSWLGD